MDKHCSKEKKREGANFAQIIRKEAKKAFCKQSHKRKKRRTNDSESDSDSDYSSSSCMSESKGELIMCKKCKLNNSVNDNTYASPNKAIQQNKIELNNKINSRKVARKKSRKSCKKKLFLIIWMCLMTPPMFLVVIYENSKNR
jgi:hypothetical protein